MLEETGRTTKVELLVMLGDYPGRVHNIYIGFLMNYVEGQPQPDKIEVDDTGFFLLKEIESINIADMMRGLAKIAFESQPVDLLSNLVLHPRDVYLRYIVDFLPVL